MADFSLTTLFVVPVGQTTWPSSGSTQDLTPGQVGFFDPSYSTIDPNGNDLNDGPYFYVAQGRENTYLQGSKRSGKIAVKNSYAPSQTANITELYSVIGCANSQRPITEVDGWNVTCGEIVTLTLRLHSSYIDTLYFNGLTRSVTVNAPCCDCGADPCTTVDVPALIDSVIAKLEECAPGNNPDNICLTNFLTFERVGADASAKLVITGKPLTKYGQPCDVAAFPFEYDLMRFSTFVYSGPATTADFIVADNCNIVANATVVQEASLPRGTSAEIKQLEKNFYSYQAGYLKHLFRMNGYNQNFESYVQDGVIYDTYYIKFFEIDRSAYQWGDYIPQDQTVIIAVPTGTTLSEDLLEGLIQDNYGTEYGQTCPTTTTTTSQVP
jgi:hypothetical protein